MANWSTFTGGLDTFGDALSGDMLGTSLPTADSVFNIGPIGSNDVVSATGQTITLPAGTDSALKLLATAVNGAQPNQTFTVTYTDGTTATLTQSISDWAAPQNFTGETTAYTFAYRDTSGGSIQGGSLSPLRILAHAGSQQDGQEHHASQRPQRRGFGGHAHPRGPDAESTSPPRSTGRAS